MAAICLATDAAAARTCGTLRERNAAVRWMSLPASRIVVNPNILEPVPLPGGLAPCLATDLAYYAGEYPIKLPCFWAWQTGDTVIAKSETWAPHALESSATTATPAVKIDTTTFLRDEATLTQIAHIVESDASAVTLVGQVEGRVTFDAGRNAVIVKSERYTARISISRPAEWLGDSSKDDLRVWKVSIGNLNAGDEIVVEARFAPKGEKLPEVAPDFSPESVREALTTREAEWNRLLGTLPHPLDFELRLVDAKGVTPDAIRRMYYKAWVFLLQDTLPPMPENGYPYPQVCCGKPSLWAEGHPKSRPSAQWESMIGMQFLSWVDPEAAWRSFEGMMTLVDENGILGGEGLPSRHVQTAWTVYCATGDTARLRNVYPALKRMLDGRYPTRAGCSRARSAGERQGPGVCRSRADRCRVRDQDRKGPEHAR